MTSDHFFQEAMLRAVELGNGARRIAPPNPWVGAVVVDAKGTIVGEGATNAPGGPHAEIVALDDAGEKARGATLVVTLEPCNHRGKTGPCTERIIAAGVARVVFSIEDPDPLVGGAGRARLKDAGIEVVEGVESALVGEQLRAYAWHRTTNRPWVVLKVASTMDGQVAMADGTSQWITGEQARYDAHELRADSQAILVGAGTVRSDNPSLTARLNDEVFEPLRVVLGTVARYARVQPCLERSGELALILDELGQLGIVQLLVEGGPTTASAFVEHDLVNHIVWYFAPALAGSCHGAGALRSLQTKTISELRRGRVVATRQIGEDIRVDLEV
jgi:diaminohydroxyphosphoribosylaminopyrimidine deaminase/5-amino-6-(5-phosphoribosylamino)uracil reductase